MLVIGAKAYVHVPKQLRYKLDPLSQVGTFLGYEPNSRAYRVLFEDGKMGGSRNVTFDETKPLIKETSDNLDFSDGSGSVEGASEASDNSDQEDHGTEEGASSPQEAAPEEPSSQEASFGEASTDTFPQSSGQQAGSRYPTRQRDKPKE